MRLEIVNSVRTTGIHAGALRPRRHVALFHICNPNTGALPSTTIPPAFPALSNNRAHRPASLLPRFSPVAMASSAPSDGKTRVLFVCLGNICRSPTAEAVFRAATEQADRSAEFFIDSCGTGGGSSNWYLEGGFSYHEGDPSDSRMTAAASRRSVHLTSRSRPLTPADVETFDYIIGMDDSNLAAIRRAVAHWQQEGRLADGSYESKLKLMTTYLDKNGRFAKSYNEVPDPYYGGSKGFELVLDLLEDACQGLLQECSTGQTRR
jgi:protein-tyrosine phosphatase